MFAQSIKLLSIADCLRFNTGQRRPRRRVLLAATDWVEMNADVPKAPHFVGGGPTNAEQGGASDQSYDSIQGFFMTPLLEFVHLCVGARAPMLRGSPKFDMGCSTLDNLSEHLVSWIRDRSLEQFLKTQQRLSFAIYRSTMFWNVCLFLVHCCSSAKCLFLTVRKMIGNFEGSIVSEEPVPQNLLVGCMNHAVS